MSLGVPENPIDQLPKPIIFQGKKPLAFNFLRPFQAWVLKGGVSKGGGVPGEL